MNGCGSSARVAPGCHATLLLDQAGWHMLSNRVFASYDNIVDHCADA